MEFVSIRLSTGSATRSQSAPHVRAVLFAVGLLVAGCATSKPCECRCECAVGDTPREPKDGDEDRDREPGEQRDLPDLSEEEFAQRFRDAVDAQPHDPEFEASLRARIEGAYPDVAIHAFRCSTDACYILFSGPDPRLPVPHFRFDTGGGHGAGTFIDGKGEFKVQVRDGKTLPDISVPARGNGSE